jgi:hypothetical protein
MSQYIIELPFIKWKKQELFNYMNSYPSTKWRHEHNRLHPDLTYINKYLRVDPTNLLDEIYNQIPELKLSHQYTFFAEISPGVLLAPHRDTGRDAVINFPIYGDWSKTPVRFHNKLAMTRESVVYEHCYNEAYPSILNVSEIHSAYNVTKETRYILSMSIHRPWNEIIEIISKYK